MDLEFWTNEINNFMENDHVIGIVGNKIDLFDIEEIDEFKARDYAKNKGAYFKLVSAKENPKVFSSFLEEMLIIYIKKKKGKIKK